MVSPKGFLVMLRVTSSARVRLLSLWGHPPLLSPLSPAPSSSSARQPKGSVLRCSWVCFLCGQTLSPPLQSFKFLPLLFTPSFSPGTPTSCPPQLTAHQPSDWTQPLGTPSWGMSKSKLSTTYPSPWLFLAECVILAGWKLINVGICHYVGIKNCLDLETGC